MLDAAGLEQLPVGGLETREAALRRPDRRTDALRLARDLQPGVGLGHPCGSDRELGDAIEPVERLSVEPAFRLEL